MPTPMAPAERVIRRPDDWHLHLRDGAALAAVLPHSAARFGRAMVMPNLKPPLDTLEAVLAYRERILSALPAGMAFEPLMTLYLTPHMKPRTIRDAAREGVVAAKLYPAGATTHSAAGIDDLEAVRPLFEAMQAVDMPLAIHGEVTDPSVDVFDRERVFIERHLRPLMHDFPSLRVVLEHITTEQAVHFVSDGPQRLAATITAHHLLYDRNALFAGGIRPHLYCLPVLKRARHRQALVAAATSGNPKFFLGTDSAPHGRRAKESACGCAGIYSAHAAIELYAEAFEQAGALDRLEGFASLHGPAFYGLPPNEARSTLRRGPWEVPKSYPLGKADEVVPLRAGEEVAWRLLPSSPAAGHT